jgi:hypothetical protein
VAHTVSPFSLQDFIRQLRNSGLATTYALQVIHEKADCIIHRLAVFSERLARVNKVRDFMLWQSYCLPSVSFEGGLLPPKFRIGFGSRFVELPSTSPGPKIEDEFISRMMPVWTNCEFGRFHEQNGRLPSTSRQLNILRQSSFSL